MSNIRVHEHVSAIGGASAFFSGAVVAGVLSALDRLQPWMGWTLSVLAVVGLVVLVSGTVSALLRGDTEGVERQNAARASMAATLVVAVSGLGYAIFEAFAGVPRLTSAVPAAVTILVWVVVYTWKQPRESNE